MKRISLDELIQSRPDATYEQQYRYVMDLMEKGSIKQVKASGTNGKKPALYREYWVIPEAKDYHLQEEELKYRLHPMIGVDYYLTHPEAYAQDRQWVCMLDAYLKKKRDNLGYTESVNERSFEIWGREKFLTREQGKTILKRCGIEPGDLNMYTTAEPLAYYSHTREVPQNLLILENKDTFYSMRRHLLEGNGGIFGTDIGTLLYGAGKRILRSFRDFELCIEPYMGYGKNNIYYFGDLDYEGIGIFENLAETFEKHWEIRPFLPAYDAMLKKAQNVQGLPDTKKQQNRNIKNRFFSYFSNEQTSQIKQILERGSYIPQEILNITDFAEYY